MKTRRIRQCLAVLCLLTGSFPAYAQPATQPAQTTAGPAISRIAFGSCVDPGKPVPAFHAITRAKPDLMIFLGDNIYANTFDEHKLRRSYRVLGQNPGFKRIKDTCRILATWDDHDYGNNDVGEEHPNKAASQRVFLDFWSVPKDSPRRKRQGVYHAQTFGPQGQRVQVILLDTRYHRSPLTRKPKRQDSPRYVGPYQPNPDPSATILGKAQWSWLAEQLKQPADLRLIVSSIQVVAEDHGWETWAMFPAERQKLFDLIRSTHANGVVILSGDRHQAEISQQNESTPYPLLDITSSALNKPGLENNEPNRHRLGKRFPLSNFGMITVDWQADPPTVTLEIIDPQGEVQIEHRVALSELAP